jgi:hypothetical protein
VPYEFPDVHYFNQKVFYSVRWAGNAAAPLGIAHNISLVFAPFVGSDGAWSIYRKWSQSDSGDYDRFPENYPRRGHTHIDSNGKAHFLGVVFSGEELIEAEVETAYSDYDAESETVDAPIYAHFTTRWFDARLPALKKRWKRPVFVMRGEDVERMTVEVLADYDPQTIKRRFEILREPDTVGGVWGDNWGTMVWTGTTGAVLGDQAVVERGSPLGTGYARALRLRNITPTASLDESTFARAWSVHDITMKWIPKRLRS